MGTKTVANGDPHGARDVHWGREVVTTTVSIVATLLVILGLIVGAVIYNAREFAVAADDRSTVEIHVEKVEAKIDALSSNIEILVEKANETHRAQDRRLDAIEQWRYSQTICGWKADKERR